MSVFEGLCRPVFCVFCVMMVRSVCMSVSRFFPANCVVVSEFECGSLALIRVLELRGGCGICLGVFGSGLGGG